MVPKLVLKTQVTLKAGNEVFPKGREYKDTDPDGIPEPVMSDFKEGAGTVLAVIDRRGSDPKKSDDQKTAGPPAHKKKTTQKKPGSKKAGTKKAAIKKGQQAKTGTSTGSIEDDF